MLSTILTDAMDRGLIPAQDPEQVIPLIHATVMGGRPTPTDPERRRAYLDSLDAFVLRAVGPAGPRTPSRPSRAPMPLSRWRGPVTPVRFVTAPLADSVRRGCRGHGWAWQTSVRESELD